MTCCVFFCEAANTLLYTCPQELTLLCGGEGNLESHDRWFLQNFNKSSCSFHKISQPEPNMSQLNPVYNFTHDFFKIKFNTNTHLYLSYKYGRKIFRNRN